MGTQIHGMIYLVAPQLGLIEYTHVYGMFPRNRGETPKMDGLYMENPMNKWMIRGYHYFWKHTYTSIYMFLPYGVPSFS